MSKNSPYLIVANWKMNPETEEKALHVAKALYGTMKQIKKSELVIAPPSVFLPSLRKLNKNKSLAAQNVFFEKNGSHTGEISAHMLHDIGVTHVIVGHSERRHMGETNGDIQKKILTALSQKLTPIVCVGEEYRDDKGEYLSFLKKQIEECFAGVPKTALSRIIIAYEPLWAIGKNAIREATPEECFETVVYIKKILADFYNHTQPKSLFLYGGSVNEKNALTFLVGGGVDGLLVGRVSLEPKKMEKLLLSIEGGK